MQTQKMLSGLRRGTPLTLERLRSSLRRRGKRRSWMSPFRMKSHNQLLLLGLINVILNLTSVSTQDNVFISWAHSYADFDNTSNCWICRAMPLSVMDGLPWWVSPLCQGDFRTQLPLSSPGDLPDPPQDRTLLLIRCPQELLPSTSLHSHPGNLGQSPPTASLLHANWVHGPGSLCSTEAWHGRGLGYRLQMLLGQPDVMELLELFHHAVFEVWV